MTAIRCDVESIGTRLLVRVTGELSVSSTSQVRLALMKCLVEQPDAVVLDLAGLAVGEAAAASVFLAVSRQAAVWPGTPLLVAAPAPDLARIFDRGYTRLAVFDSVDAALAAEPGPRLPAISDMMLPASGAPRRARDVVTEACLRWALPQLIDRASVIAGELVTNAVVHARTMLSLRLTLSRRHLLLAVRDGSAEVPLLPAAASTDPAAPRGLLLVDALSVRWGSQPTHDGKVVWATLPRS
ncbi:ATP-binding protein [Actinoplanes philippinensis]|uniref:STAS domain-containing protein n=1 Tax=Actinoplanes philippinensis TaxID=35752 RepID=UPI000B8715AE|nr:STAS domain-containing protein [Actinoplanes philippinensis]GIE77038.1 ATP-binding protein [Actinoplanes philippinensis]